MAQLVFGVFQIWTYEEYEIQIQNRMPFFPCHEKALVSLVSKKVIRVLLKNTTVSQLQTTFLQDVAVRQMMYQYKYKKRPFDQTVNEEEIRFILAYLSKLSYQTSQSNLNKTIRKINDKLQGVTFE